MADDDRSLFDKVKDAFGMGGDDHEHDHAADEDRPDHDNLGVDGATQGAGSTGAAGGMGASAGLGGAGAGGPAGATPDPSKDVGEPSDGNQVRTEYEMGHELDPAHEQVAESGVLAEQSGDAVVDTWRGGDEGRQESGPDSGSSLDDETPGSQGEIEAGSEGDFGKPA